MDDDAPLAAVVGAFAGDGAVLGIALYGSATMDGLRPHSDLDVLVVVAEPTTLPRRAELTRTLLGISAPWGPGISVPRGPGGAGHGRPVELTIVRREALDPWPAVPQREYQFGEWRRGAYEAGEVPGPTDDHDLAPLVATAQTASRTLAGAPLRTLLPAVPRTALEASMRATVPGLLAEVAGDEVNVLLTLARIWFTTTTGTIVSKAHAGTWAAERVPAVHRRALLEAVAAYEGRRTGDEAPGAAAAAAWLAGNVRP